MAMVSMPSAWASCRPPACGRLEAMSTISAG
jgi:hypothetical protein